LAFLFFKKWIYPFDFILYPFRVKNVMDQCNLMRN